MRCRRAWQGSFQRHKPNQCPRSARDRQVTGSPRAPPELSDACGSGYAGLPGSSEGAQPRSGEVGTSEKTATANMRPVETTFHTPRRWLRQHTH